MQTNNLDTLKIHRLTKEQYEREKAAGRLDPTALYMTEATSSSPSLHTHDASDITSGVLDISVGGTGSGTAAGAIAGLSGNKLTLNTDNTLNGAFNSLVINGIDFTLTSAEYDELLSLAGGV